MEYKATEEVKYKDLVEELINDILKAKKVFEHEYDGSSVYKDFRWREHMEGLFVDQLEKLTRRVSKGEFPEQAIGEYVMEFFVVSEDERLFDIKRVDFMVVTVILITGESIQGTILEESQSYIVLRLKDGSKVSILAKENIKSISWIEVDF